MITFTDKRLFLKGVGNAYLLNPNTFVVEAYSNKFTTGNFNTSTTQGEIRAGIGNAIATMIPSDAAVEVEFTAQDYLFDVKAMQLGATTNYGAPVMVCSTFTAVSAVVSTDLLAAAPVAPLGYGEAVVWVQETGTSGTIAQTGTPYTVSGTTISGFTATVGKTYKAWSFANKAVAHQATITTMIDPAVKYFFSEFPVYANQTGTASLNSTRVGTLYGIVPRLKLNGNGGITGDQSNNDTTVISGQAIAYDDDVISDTCDSCGTSGSVLAYYVYVPCEPTDEIVGLVLTGGVITVAVGETVTPKFYLVMKDGSLVVPEQSKMGYTSQNLPSGTTVESSTGTITAGTTAGDGEIGAVYNDGTLRFTCIANVVVTAGA